MKNKWLFFLIFSLVLVMTGCGGDANGTVPEANGPDTAPANQLPENSTEPGGSTDSSSAPRPTITPAAPVESETVESYPPPPPPTAAEEGYPSVIFTQPSTQAYPIVEGFVWMARAAGEQCGEVELPTLSDAVAELQGVGIEVQEPHTASLAVCQACGCPTSLHFWAQVPEDGVNTAENLGWSLMEP